MGEQSGEPRVVDDAYVNKPSTLRQSCINKIGKCHQLILRAINENCESSEKWQISKNLFIPLLLTDEIFQHFIKKSLIPVPELVWAFSDNVRCRLRECKLSNVGGLRYDALASLCTNQNLQVLDLRRVDVCPPGGSLKKLLTPSMQLFHIGIDVTCHQASQSIKILSKEAQPCLRGLKVVDNTVAWYLVINGTSPPALTTLELSNFPQVHQPHDVVLEAVNLQTDSGVLVENDFSEIFGLQDHASGDMVLEETSTVPIEDLDAIMVETLNPPDVEVEHDESSNSPLLIRYRLASMKETLLSLTLHQTFLGPKDFTTIFQLYKLQHLDISQKDPQSGSSWGSSRPDITVWNILDALPRLQSLDVSSTEIGDRLYKDSPAKSITGERYLNPPVERRLEFLGLLETEGCEISNIHLLADKVTGYANELQMVTGIEVYMHRPVLSTICYNHLYALHRNQPITCPHKLLRLLLESMDTHPQEGALLLTCTANFFFLTRRYYSTYSKQQLRCIILSIIKCLERSQTSNLVVRNCLLTLFHFDVPGDFIFCYERMARVVLNTFKLHQRNPDINSIAVHMCNTLVCSLDHDMKKEVSERIDFVHTILGIIKDRHDDELCDEVMEVCWSTLWNVTDETPKNSSDFITLNGLTLLQDCFNTFSDRLELHKNMMGLIGNIAEVKSLRPFLRTKKLINLFRSLMNKNDNIEISYNSCGALAHIMSDGAEVWAVPDVDRDQVLHEMYDIVGLWNVQSPRHINYRSFKPILGLIEGDVPVSIHWACWALSNLSGLEDRYCRLLLKENGREILRRVASKQVLDSTKTIASEILQRLENFQTREPIRRPADS